MLFWSYGVVDFWSFFMSLIVIRSGGAGLMIVASAAALSRPTVNFLITRPSGVVPTVSRL